MESGLKNIVFHVPNHVHQEAFDPIATEAAKRGYRVEFASTVPDDADIVFYNTHHSEIPAVRGKLSIITFHGVDDAYKQSYYVDESWDRFDIGLLPGEQAATVWQSKSYHSKVHPSMGVYVTGWPKADRVITETFQAEVNKYKQQLDIKGKTVLYAPTIEYENKLSDFLSNITDDIDTVLIKHAPYDNIGDYSAVEAHSGNTNIHILDNDMDTMVALALSNILVSDQSSVLQEAILVDTIPVSVTDWPISFHGEEEYFPGESLPNFAATTVSSDLDRQLNTIFERERQYQSQIKEVKQSHYSYVGNSAKKIVDLIDEVNKTGSPEMQPVQANYSRKQYLRSVPTRAYFWARESFYQKTPESIRTRLERSPISTALRVIDKMFK